MSYKEGENGDKVQKSGEKDAQNASAGYLTRSMRRQQVLREKRGGDVKKKIKGL